MKHDIFDFHHDMTWYDRLWRIVLLVFCICVLAYDLFIGRPM